MQTDISFLLSCGSMPRIIVLQKNSARLSDTLYVRHSSTQVCLKWHWQKLMKALKEAAIAIRRDIVETKLHINGCVGVYRHEECFGPQYILPNDAYLETCAGVGLAFFCASVFRLTGDGNVWETIENTLTNLMPAAVSEDGVHYTYENPLESNGDRERWAWHSCPCCPPMLLKLVGIMPSYIYAMEGDSLWLNIIELLLSVVLYFIAVRKRLKH